VSSQSQGVVSYNRLAANRLAANRLAANRLAANRLAANHLNGVQALNSAAAADLLATPDGIEVLTYIVSCALPPDEQLVAPDGTVFVGGIGVAPEWLDQPLDEDGQRWLSACLFSRVSDLDVTVPISLRGPNSGLVLSPGENTEFTLQQGAFYGNLFTQQDQPILWEACSGADDDAAVANQRICASPDPANPGFTLCGFNYTGQCQSTNDNHHGWGWGRWNHHDDGACERYDSHGTYFEDCELPITEDFHGGRGHHDFQVHFDEQVDEVITVYVSP
jgi:hypothetical protein